MPKEMAQHQTLPDRWWTQWPLCSLWVGEDVEEVSFPREAEPGFGVLGGYGPEGWDNEGSLQ